MSSATRSMMALLAALLVPATLSAQDADTRFADDVSALTRYPHRLAGSVAAREAAAHLAGRLRALGLDTVIEHPFRTVGMEVARCELVLADADGEGAVTLPLEPMRPNGIMAPVAPEAGIRGRLVRFDADGNDFGEQSPEGAIVVLDYNTEAEWLRAFRMGASAVILTRADRHEARFRHAVEADANLPRFYFDGPAAALPIGREAAIHSEIRWHEATAHNVYGLLRGTDPVFDLETEELLILTARLDAYGEVPGLAAGARGAANCAALLAVAEALTADRPRRNVLFAFLDAEARGHGGSSALYRALEASTHAASPRADLESLANERVMLERLNDALRLAEPVTTQQADVRRELLDRLRAKAETGAFDAKHDLFVLRETLHAAHDDALPDDSVRVRDLRAAIESGAASQHAWNDLRRYLVTLDAPPDGMVLDFLHVILDEVRDDVRIRLHELDAEQVSAEAGLALHEAAAGDWVSLHLTLMFGDARPRWGLVIGGDSDWRSEFDLDGLYGRIQSTLMNAYTRAQQDGVAPVGFETRSVDGSLGNTRLLWGAPWLVHGGEIAGRLGIYNAVLGSVLDPLSREGTPCDTTDNLDLDTIAQQAREAAVLLRYAASEPGLSLRRSIRESRTYVTASCSPAGRLTGPAVMARSSGSSIPNRRTPDAVIRLANSPRAAARPIPAFDNFQVLLSNRNGSYAYGPVTPDPHGGIVRGFAAVFDAQGRVALISTQDSHRRVAHRLNLFPGRAGAAVVTPQFAPGAVSMLRAAGNSPLSEDRGFGQTADGVVFWYAEDRIDTLKLFGIDAIVRLHNGPDYLIADAPVTDPEGEGFSLVDPAGFPRSAARSAADLWRLNESRLAVLRSRGVNNASVEELHGRAQDLVLDATERDDPSYDESLNASSFLMQKRVYQNVRATLNDLVRAVLILLLLSVPFAFALERLLIGSTTIYKRLLGFVCFFVLTFLLLYVTHPAFAISATPIIIFLGFAIVLLSSLVIVVIMNKFEHELKVLQGAASTVHAADVSRLSTILAAMNMGISTMRRRPLRTALTAVTIILLTFTILCFASFGTRIGIVRVFLDAGPTYSAVLVRDVRWRALNQPVRQTVEARWSSRAGVASRYWLSPAEGGRDGVLVSSADGRHLAAMQGVLGIDAAELRYRPDLAALLPDADAGLDKRVWMTSGAARMIAAEPGDTVIAGGYELTLAGHIDAAALVTAMDMDGSSVLPVDFRAERGTTGQTALSDLPPEALLDQPDWSYLPADAVIVVPTGIARGMGAQLRALTLYTEDRETAVDIAGELARIAASPVAVTTPQGVFRFMLGNVVQASGFQDLFFPILLGGLVVFGTMLGSVADREREIYTFSALGLAPPHVASLFFAEAMVFSVIGGLGGYLLAQATMKVMDLLAGFGLVTVPELNYSSMNAIVTILIVMATVLVSAFYPAIRASRSANPGLLRSWRLPAPDGDTLEIVFPFTVSAYDITGVVSFLREHFNNYTDSGMGTFMAREAELVRRIGTDATVALRAELALAPFDLGVTQTFLLESVPSEIEGIDEVRIRIGRLSGQPKDWHRLNKVLLDDLRKQFLIWRALPQETMETYRQSTLQASGMTSGHGSTARPTGASDGG